MAFPGGSLSSLLQGVVSCSQHVMTLPAVPTRDWCEKASEVLAPLAPAGIAVVVLGTVDDRGRILDVEQVGVSAASTAGASDRVTSALRAFKTRANRLANIGFDLSAVGPQHQCVKSPTTCAAGLIGTLPDGKNWHTGAIGRLLNGIVEAEPVVGIVSLPDAPPTSKRSIRVVNGEGTRSLIYVLSSFTSAIDPIHGSVARSIMPSLALRAMLAFGNMRGTNTGFLTPRESQVLEQLVAGLSIRKIADDMERSPHTVHDYVKSLHRKLSANSRGELVARALGHDPELGVIRGRLTNVEPKPLPMPTIIANENGNGEAH